MVGAPKTLEAVFNLLLGLSIIGWAVAGVEFAEERSSVARLTIVALNLEVGLLILLRAPVVSQPNAFAVSVALPSIVVSAIALKLAPPMSTWPATSQALIGAGGVFAGLAFFCLGRSFSILPALRGIVVHGPYQFVRHPAYAGELAMLLGCAIASATLVVSLSVLLAIPLIVARIKVEESLLSKKESYRRYCQRVRWRLLPFMW